MGMGSSGAGNVNNNQSECKMTPFVTAEEEVAALATLQDLVSATLRNKSSDSPKVCLFDCFFFFFFFFFFLRF